MLAVLSSARLMCFDSIIFNNYICVTLAVYFFPFDFGFTQNPALALLLLEISGFSGFGIIYKMSNNKA